VCIGVGKARREVELSNKRGMAGGGPKGEKKWRSPPDRRAMEGKGGGGGGGGSIETLKSETEWRTMNGLLQKRKKKKKKKKKKIGRQKRIP